MKKIAILLGLTASFFMFAGCASQGNTESVAPADAGTTVHKNLKGEVSAK